MRSKDSEIHFPDPWEAPIFAETAWLWFQFVAVLFTFHVDSQTVRKLERQRQDRARERYYEGGTLLRWVKSSGPPAASAAEESSKRVMKRGL